MRVKREEYGMEGDREVQRGIERKKEVIGEEREAKKHKSIICA